MKSVLIGLAIFSICATGIKLLKKDVWWIRMFDFPQAQYTFLAIASFAGLIFYFDQNSWVEILLLIVLAITIIYQISIILPFTIIYPLQVKNAEGVIDESSTISILVINVFQENTNYTHCLDVVDKRNADVILAVEADEKWYKVFSQLKEKYPYKCLHPLNNTYGMVLYSKLALENAEVKFLIEKDVPSIHTYVRLRSGRRIKLYGVHPEPPSPTENSRSTERDAELFLVGKEARDITEPVIVAGDLNDVAWSESTKAFQRISGLLDPRIGRGFYNTFNAKYPLLRWPLDHIFHSTHFTVKHLERLGKTGSDHFPIYVELYCNSENKKKHEKPQPEVEDYENSKEKIEKARED